jgi:hypothetical protein
MQEVPAAVGFAPGLKVEQAIERAPVRRDHTVQALGKCPMYLRLLQVGGVEQRENGPNVIEVPVFIGFAPGLRVEQITGALEHCTLLRSR